MTMPWNLEFVIWNLVHWDLEFVIWNLVHWNLVRLFKFCFFHLFFKEIKKVQGRLFILFIK